MPDDLLSLLRLADDGNPLDGDVEPHGPNAVCEFRGYVILEPAWEVENAQPVTIPDQSG